LKKKIILLVEIQHVNSEMDRLSGRRKDLPLKQEELGKELQRERSRFEDAQTRLQDAQKAHREKEDLLRRGVEQVKRTKERLLEVKNNKEYQAMLKEIETQEGKNSKIEDEVIMLLDEIDRVKVQLKAGEKEFAAFQSEYEGKRKSMEEEVKAIERELARSSARLDDARKRVDASLLKKYETIRSRRNGRAVVPVWKEVCGGCHMNIPPQMYNDLQRFEEIMQCPYCGRIIYWEDRSKDESS